MATNSDLRKFKWEASLGDAQRALNYLILATPTGRVRNALTEANILLMEAEGLMKEEEGRDDE